MRSAAIEREIQTGCNALDDVAKLQGVQKPKRGRIDPEDADGRKKSQATLLLELAQRATRLHDADGRGYAVHVDKGIRRVWPVRSKAFKDWLCGGFFALTGKGCNTKSLNDALATVEAIALHKGVTSTFHLRVARQDGALFIDLCDDEWRCIRVDKVGWEVLKRSPVNFIRRNGMTALPEPKRDGTIGGLRQFLNVENEDFPLIVGWMLGALRGVQPYPPLVLQGEQGTGKSTLTRVARGLTDPSTVPLRCPPREVRDLLVSAMSAHVVALDNLSGLSPEMSDALCRLATGGGHDARKLFTDDEQVLVDLERPVIVNGIDDIATRPDLGERSLILNLPTLTHANHKDDAALHRDYAEATPKLLGALLDGLSAALRDSDAINLPQRFRMSDFAKWAEAGCRGAGLENDAFLKAYRRNVHHAAESGIEASPVGSAILALMTAIGGTKWTGTPTQTLARLAELAGGTAQSKAWPQSPKGLKNVLRRLAPALRRLGIFVEQEDSGNRAYTIRQAPLQPPQPPQTPETTAGADSSAAVSWRMADSSADRVDGKTEPPCTEPNIDAGSGGYGTYGGYNMPSGNAPNGAGSIIEVVL
jgi:hypothetical protein